MQNTVSVGLVGDYDHAVPAHQAIPLALQHAADSLGIKLAFGWVPTTEISTVSRISSFNGIWCVPVSPYRNTDGALLAIRHARESQMPFLGTCGGFQHAVIEYARNVLGWEDAEHAEITPDAQRTVIAPLECSLVEVKGQVRFSPNSHIATAYQASAAVEGYRCRYGLNLAFRSELLAGPLRATAEDESGEVRGIELDGHPFFVGTLFQPERGALVGKPVPLAIAFLQACAP
ncbi:CTP synthase C-terminal region-related (seleno)protein [Acidithiobacillus ferriphilus]|uniref:CTP synthase C-terminal region-related (seleno)protein n=1 Tax=Acidithiobacillus ferriphilus TaxID=1689834 RepID=UPI004057767E